MIKIVKQSRSSVPPIGKAFASIQMRHNPMLKMDPLHAVTSFLDTAKINAEQVRMPS
jgi:hypothetical protein